MSNTTRTIVQGVTSGTLIGVLVGVLLGMTYMATKTSAHATASHPTYEQQLERIHHCWTDEAPASQAGKVPAGVIVQYAHSNAPDYRHNPKAVGAALGHVFDGTHPHLTVLAFCAG